MLLCSPISIVQRVVFSVPSHSPRIGGELPEVPEGGLGLEVVGENVECGAGHQGLEGTELSLRDDHAPLGVNPGSRGHGVVLDLDPALDIVPHPVTVGQVSNLIII